MTFPTEDTIALTAFLLGADEWRSADEIRHAIAQLGFEMPSSQWVVGKLVAMTRESAPRFKARDGGGFAEYRVTHCAATDLENQWRGFSRTVMFT